MGVEPRLAASAFVPRTALPKHLVAPLGLTRLFAEDGLHSLVHGLRPKLPPMTKHTGRSSDNPQCAKRLALSFGGAFAKSHTWALKGIARKDDSVLGKPSLQPGQPRTNAVHTFGQQPVGDAGKAVLFLDECGDAFSEPLGPTTVHWRTPTPTTACGLCVRNRRRASTNC